MLMPGILSAKIPSQQSYIRTPCRRVSIFCAQTRSPNWQRPCKRRLLNADTRQLSKSKHVSCRAYNESLDIEYVHPPSEGKLESENLRESLRKQVQGAVEQLGGRVTVGDVSARAGVKVSEAEEVLNALAADCNGSIQVSQAGDAVYVFPSNFAAIIQSRSFWLRIAPLINRIKETAGWLARVSFGAALVASVALVWITIIALMTASSQDNDRNNNRGGGRGYGGGGYSGGYYYRSSPMIWWDASDLLWFQSRRTPQKSRNSPMSFLESIFSFVFGDGDPNRTYEEKRWQMVGRYIQSKGGVVTAEELAPFLDPPPPSQDEDDVEESFVVPALVRFGGSPEVDSSGNLLYRFESLQRSGGARVSSPDEPAALQNLWEQTRATGGQRTGAIALGAANLLGIGILANWQSGLAALANTNLGFMLNLLPYLSIYAASFFVVPAVRWVLNQQRNAKLTASNQNRLERLRALRDPEPRLQKKLMSAQQHGKRTVIREKDIIYRTDRDLDDQRDHEGADFDERLKRLDNASKRLDNASGRSFNDWIPSQQEAQEAKSEDQWRRR